MHPEMSGICQYHADTLPREILHKGVRAHSHLFVNETLTIINPHYIDRKSLSQPATNGLIELDCFISGILNHESVS